MLNMKTIFFSLCVSALAMGCGDDGGSSADGGDVDGGDGGMTTVTVMGTVVAEADDGSSEAIEGAIVTVLSTGASGTTDANGVFELEVPVGKEILTTSATDHWGIARLVDVPSTGLTLLELDVLPDAIVDMVAMALPRTVSDSDGIVVVGFDYGDDMMGEIIPALGGETATIDATNAGAFAFDGEGEGNPMNSSVLFAGGDTDLIFTGVDPSDSPTTATVTGKSGASDCVLNEPGMQWPVLAKTITEIESTCTLL